MDKNTLMTNMAREAHEKGLFNGAWLFAEHGKIISKGVAGSKDPDGKVPLEEDSVFDLASVSKQFTASAIMLLRRRGLLDIDDELEKFFPEIPYKGITIKMLLTHTSGLPDYMVWIDKLAMNEHRIPDNHTVIRYLVESGDEAFFAPGEKYEYCNTGYCVLAEIVEKVSGVKFEDFMRDNIFEPAGMHSTRVYHPRKDNYTIENWAHDMVPDNGKFAYPEKLPKYDWVVTLDGEHGDGYVYSNIFDLFTWDKVLKEGTLLTKEEQEIMYTPYAKLGEEEEGIVGYGFGWVVYDSKKWGRVLSHSGGWAGVNTWIGRYLDLDRVLILLSSCDPMDGRAAEIFETNMSAIGRGEETKPFVFIEDIMVKDPDKSKWQSYCGKYEAFPGTDYVEEVVMRDGDLYAVVVNDIDRRYELKLYPIGESTFSFKESDDEIEFREDCFVADDEVHKKL